jgi:small subunit ribosomal protein S20
VKQVPNTKSAKKRNRVEKRKTLRNKIIKTNLKTVCKNAIESLKGKEKEKNFSIDKEKASHSISIAEGRLDKAVAKGIIHKNRAARKKSRLMKQFNKLTASKN